jgi:predicted GNAT family N-acyltransferase
MIRRAGLADMDAVFDIRRVVFIEGQNVPENEERDSLDDSAIHMIAYQNDTPVGTARLILGEHYAKIGRVAVLENMRGKGLGKAIMQASLDELRAEGMAKVRLAAQTHALGFYKDLGFQVYGETFLDAGILHKNMVLSL